MIYTHTCVQCNASFKSLRPQSKFCSGNCRVKSVRKKVETKTEEILNTPKNAEKNASPQKILEKSGFLRDEPNWKRNGFKSAEEGILYAIGLLIKQSKDLQKIGLSDEVIIVWRGRILRI